MLPAVTTEMIKGKNIEEALKLTNKAVAEASDGLPFVKLNEKDLLCGV